MNNCNGAIWPPCLAELHALELGIFLGVLAYIIYLRSRFGLAMFLSIVVFLTFVRPIDGLVKPWYSVGGVVVGLLLSRLVNVVWERKIR
jgi:hypothetical protein